MLLTVQLHSANNYSVSSLHFTDSTLYVTMSELTMLGLRLERLAEVWSSD